LIFSINSLGYYTISLNL